MTKESVVETAATEESGNGIIEWSVIIVMELEIGIS